MPLPVPGNYATWQQWGNAILNALGINGGISAQGQQIVQGLVSGAYPPDGYSPVWLSDDEARLYLGNHSYDPPTASDLFRIDTAKLADAAVATAKLADSAVTSAKILDATIGSADIANAAILSALIGDLQVITAKIADLAVNNAKIANLAVSSAKIANLAVATAAIQDAAITTSKILDATILTADIGNAQITQALIANLAVGTAQIIDAAIAVAKIGDLQVNTQKVTDAAIINAKIYDGSITTAKIQDASITSAKIGNLQVSSANIADLTIGTTKIAPNAISLGGNINSSSGIVYGNSGDCNVYVDGSGYSVSRWQNIIYNDFSVPAACDVLILATFKQDKADPSGNPIGTAAELYAPQDVSTGGTLLDTYYGRAPQDKVTLQGSYSFPGPGAFGVQLRWAGDSGYASARNAKFHYEVRFK